jgi:replicative DNA helicase
MTLKPRILTTAEVAAMHQAEECLLGAILIGASDGLDDRGTINACAFIVKPADFWDFDARYPVNIRQCQNGRIYSAMLACKGPPHVVNVATEMSARGLLRDGDQAHLSHCIAEVPTHLDWNDYAISVRYYSQLRNSVIGGEKPTSQQVRGGVTLGPV